jgi:hypothetical protein
VGVASTFGTECELCRSGFSAGWSVVSQGNFI